MSQLNIRTRIYEDYLKKSRLNEYAKLLTTAKNEGYKMLSIIDFYRFIKGGTAIGEKILINRHDIDTSPNVAAKMFEIEKSIYGQNGSSTYYFRDCTL